MSPVKVDLTSFGPHTSHLYVTGAAAFGTDADAFAKAAAAPAGESAGFAMSGVHVDGSVTTCGLVAAVHQGGPSPS